MLFYWMWIDQLYEHLLPSEPLGRGRRGSPRGGGTGGHGGDRVCGDNGVARRGPRGHVGSPGQESTVETGREGRGGARKGGRRGSAAGRGGTGETGSGDHGVYRPGGPRGHACGSSGQESTVETGSVRAAGEPVRVRATGEPVTGPRRGSPGRVTTVEPGSEGRGGMRVGERRGSPARDGGARGSPRDGGPRGKPARGDEGPRGCPCSAGWHGGALEGGPRGSQGRGTTGEPGKGGHG